MIATAFGSVRQPLLFAASLANLYLLPTWSALLPYAVGLETHALARPRREDYIAALLLYTALTAIVVLVMRAVARTQSRLLHGAAGALIGLGLVIPLNLMRTLGGTYSVGVILGNRPATIAVLAVAAVIGLILMRRRLLGAATMLVILLSPLAAITLAEAAWGAATVAGGLAPPASANPPIPLRRDAAARVVVVFFDEWDLAATFLNRPDDVRLPEIDRFRQAALHSTAAYSPAGSTLLSISAVLSGKRVTVITGRPDGGVDLTLDGQSKRERFEDAGALFGRLHREGVRSGLVGWAVPYCHTFAAVLAQCQQLDHGVIFNQPSPMLARMSRQFRNVMPWYGKQSFIEMVREAVDHSEQMAADPSLDFVWLHLPGPHLPVFYDRAAHDYTMLKFDEADGYFDNLAWVDDTLGRLRGSMERTGTWQRSSIILTSDHSWRRSAMADGTRDRRVPLLVKLPDGPGAFTHDRPFNTMAIADVIDRLLRDGAASYASVVRWLEQSPVAAVAPVPSS